MDSKAKCTKVSSILFTINTYTKTIVHQEQWHLSSFRLL